MLVVIHCILTDASFIGLSVEVVIFFLQSNVYSIFEFYYTANVYTDRGKGLNQPYVALYLYRNSLAVGRKC